MRRLVGALALTTALFAASTGYLAYRLYGRESALSAGIAAAPAPGTAALDGMVETPAARNGKPGSANATPVASNAQNPGGTAAGPRSAATHEADKNREMILPFARQYLERIADPVQHAALLAQSRGELQRQYAPLHQRLKLDSATFDQLVDLIAEQQLQAQESYFRCVVDPACDTEEYARRPTVGDPDQEFLALLGPDRMDEFNHYRQSIGERDSVAQLRGRLDEANMLHDEQAEQLIAALAKEHDLYKREVAASGATLKGWGTAQGMLWYIGDGSIDQQLSSAAAYSQRLRARAATMLTSQQLTSFNQLQDELLAAMTTYLRPAH